MSHEPSAKAPDASQLNASASGWFERTTLTQIFKSGIVVSTVTYLLFWFELTLFGSLLSPETGDALAWQGYGALLQFPPAVGWLRMLLWIAIAIGMYSFSAAARSLYLILFAFDLVMTLLAGIGVSTALGGFLATIFTFADGVLLTLAYLSPLRKHFR